MRLIGDRISAYRVWVRRPELRRPLGRITLKWNFKKWDGEAWTRLTWLRTGTGCCECGDELSVSMKYGEFLDWLRTCYLLTKDSVPCSFEGYYILNKACGPTIEGQLYYCVTVQDSII